MEPAKLSIMTSITTRIIVTEDGRISSAVQLPPGDHVATVEIVGRPQRQPAKEPFDISKLPVLDIGPWPWPEGTTFSREEIYGDDGR